MIKQKLKRLCDFICIFARGCNSSVLFIWQHCVNACCSSSSIGWRINVVYNSGSYTMCTNEMRLRIRAMCAVYCLTNFLCHPLSCSPFALCVRVSTLYFLDGAASFYLICVWTRHFWSYLVAVHRQYTTQWLHWRRRLFLILQTTRTFNETQF